MKEVGKELVGKAAAAIVTAIAGYLAEKGIKKLESTFGKKKKTPKIADA
jgi:cell division protein FtsN